MTAEIIARLEWYEEAQGKGLQTLIKQQTEALDGVMEAADKLNQVKDTLINTQETLLRQREALVDHLKSQSKTLCEIGIDLANTIISDRDQLPFEKVNKAQNLLRVLLSINSLYESVGFDSNILEWAAKAENPE